MIYREYLVMRKGLAWYAGAVLVLAVISLVPFRVGGVSLDGADIAFTSGVFAGLFAWIFGVALGNGSREAARVLWVLPTERWKLALQVIAVDLAGTTVAFAFEYAITLVVVALISLHFRTEIHGVRGADIMLALALTYATYGWGALVGMCGRRIAYSGLVAAPALAIWLTVAESPSRIGAILRVPIVANPFAVFNTTIAIRSWEQQRYAIDRVSSSMHWLGTTWEMPVLFAIAAATCTLTVVLWQRAQVIS